VGGDDFSAYWDNIDPGNAAPEPEPVKPNGPDPNPWPVLDDGALYGLAGEVVNEIAPHSEADPAALLIQFLASFGNSVGRGPYYQVEGDRHATNLCAIIVGDTAKARKGVSKGRVEQVMRFADPEWVENRVDSGLSSGEGLIWAVRDPITKFVKEGKGADAKLVEVISDPGVPDKRLYVVEPEFSGVLTVAKRQGNTLSKYIRQAWDGGNLATIVKTAPARTTGALISIIGHITAAEFRNELDQVNVANGFANRFLIVCAKRSKVLPFGGSLSAETCAELGARVVAAIEMARGVGALSFDATARAGWAKLYPILSEAQPGLLGALLARAEAHVVRLATHYALLDRSGVITLDHLKAATALFEYVQDSSKYVFGDLLGDTVADAILAALRHAGRNYSAARIARALSILAQQGKAEKTTQSTGGRPAEIWMAT
jgi:hypothetical protein